MVSVEFVKAMAVEEAVDNNYMVEENGGVDISKAFESHKRSF